MTERLYVIRKYGGFYRPARSGYCNSIRDAGVYTWREASQEAEVEKQIHEDEHLLAIEAEKQSFRAQ